MPFEQHHDDQTGLLRVRVSGRTEPAEWMSFVKEARDGLSREVDVLIDVRAHETPVDSPTLRGLAFEVQHDAHRVRGRRWALIVSQIVSHGMGRMLAAYVSEFGVEVQIFEDETSAEAWLLEARD